MKRKLKPRYKNWLILIVVIIFLIILCKNCLTKSQYVTKSQNKAVESEQLFDEANYIQSNQKFACEPKKVVKIDVKTIAEEIGIEYELLEAIIQHETGHRTSRAFKKLNNPCGMMFWNGSKMALRQYATIEDGYYACARNLKNNYIDKGLTTIEQIQKKYAPVGINDKGNVNKYWVSGVTSIYNKLKNNE